MMIIMNKFNLMIIMILNVKLDLKVAYNLLITIIKLMKNQIFIGRY